MQDRPLQFQLTSVLATLAGCVGVALVAVNFFCTSDSLGDAGLVFVTLAALLRVRSWLCHLSQRERNAFELGRDSVRSLR